MPEKRCCVRARKASSLYFVSASARARAPTSLARSGLAKAARITSANGRGEGSARKAVSSESTCVCVRKRVATIGRPDRRYW
jgi:hypothetical protein